jgi:hypothetical protein
MALTAQAVADDGQAAPSVFPIHRLWEDAEKAAIRWSPDWPFEIPPDSFAPITEGRANRITVTITGVGDFVEGGPGSVETGGSLETGEFPDENTERLSAIPLEYTMRLNPDGGAAEFPFLLDGVFYQASARYNREGEIEAMTRKLSPEESVEVAVLQTDEGRPLIARIKTGGVYYFASFLWQAGGCVEMWTDAGGIPIALFRDERTFYYDSMQNITMINDGVSETSARYNGSGVRYWTMNGTVYSFQRNENGLLVRLTAYAEADSGSEAEPPPAAYSYEYAFDQNGNWTERREIRWIETDGYLAPTRGTVITRIIGYN